MIWVIRSGANMVLLMRLMKQKTGMQSRYLAIDQGPEIVMIENYRSGLMWKLFMSVPEIQTGLQKLGFESPYLASK